MVAEKTEEVSSQDKETTKQVSWNLAEYITQSIAQLLNQSAQGNANNHFAESVGCLKSIRFIISADLTTEELKELDKVEAGFFFAWSKAQPYGFNPTDFQQLSLAYFLHKKYSDLLMFYLKKYGYYIPIKKDKTLMGG